MIVEAVRRARAVKGWSAERLADEMAAIGIPWNNSVVVNLELGRRKSLRVHELLALMYVLEVPKPLEVLVPGERGFPVTPGLQAGPAPVRAWLRGETPPLRQALAPSDADLLESAAQMFEEDGRPDKAAQIRRLAQEARRPASRT